MTGSWPEPPSARVTSRERSQDRPASANQAAICWREKQKGVHGNTVHATLQDYPRTADDQDWLRLYRFRPAEKKIEVWTYSPQQDRVCDSVSFRKDRAHHQFTLDLD